MLCSLPGFIVLLGIIVYPLAYNFVTSFMRYDNLSPVVFNGFKNYLAIFKSGDFYQSWKVSSIYSLGTTAAAVTTGIVLATSLSRVRRFQSLFRTMVILPWAAPLVVSGLIWKWILSTDLGVANYLLGLLGIGKVKFLVTPTLAVLSGIAGTTWAYIPFTTILILASFETIPDPLYEAADIDGATSVQKFWHIRLALAARQILVTALIVFMFTFRTPDMFVSLTGGGPGKATYHAGIYLKNTIYQYLNFGHGAAIGVLLFVTIAVPASIILYKGLLKKT